MKLLGELKDLEFEYMPFDHERLIARGILMNSDNKIALIKIDGTDEFGLRDYYETPGGGVKENERIEDAVIREVIEETGYNSHIVSEIGLVIDYYNLIRRKNYSYYFLLKADNYIGQNLDQYEKGLFSNVKFYTLDEAIDLYTNHMNGKVGRIVKNRELLVLNELKNILMK